ncbi:MAG TPA: glycosyltransferase family 39 protein [Candidatus Binataceae bacterium]|nr:glycosyltransferase family 39 protein [Candidatus Binataceae bacterium]
MVAFLPGLFMPVLWFALVFLLARPLANGPVADSWIYFRTLARLKAGVMSLPGYTAAIPVAQILYGVLWARLFGLTYVSLDWSVALLGIAGAMLFYLLARRCNASPRGAALATALLIVNPCYLFLSFSFMTDVPFVTLLIAARLIFAAAQQGWSIARLWVCAALLVAAFMVRPFALAAMAGCAAVTLLARRPGTDVIAEARRLLPFLGAAVASVLIWLGVKTLIPIPWMLDLRAGKLNYLYWVPIRVYFIDALAAPLLYLGLVLSPLALPHLISPRWRQGLGIAAGLAVVILPLLLTDPHAKSIPELSCCGGWSNVLVLRGPLRFVWTDARLRLAVLTVSILGIAGLVLAATEITAASPGFLAVIISAAIYWAGTVPLWLFNDRYYLVMLPAGCLLLALAPAPRGAISRALTLAMLVVMGWFAAAGVYDQQRGLDTVIAVRDGLIRDGVARNAIDAGYPLNGNDLYRDPEPGGRETGAMEAGIPLITTLKLKPYTIAAVPIPGSVIIQRFQWPGVLGVGHRPLYLLKTGDAALAPPGTSEGLHSARRADLPAEPGLTLIMIRLASMVLMMLAPLLAVIACFVKPLPFPGRQRI